jgi:hypothetical protein
MKVWLFKMNSLSFILHPSYFRLALPIRVWLCYIMNADGSRPDRCEQIIAHGLSALPSL